jgi:hypothetical protein
MTSSRSIAARGGGEDISIGWEREWLGYGGVMVVRWLSAGSACACGCRWEWLCVFVFISPGVIAIVVEVIININRETSDDKLNTDTPAASAPRIIAPSLAG